MPLVRKSKYHQKKQDIHQLKNQNQQLQSQLTELQALQKQKPTEARALTIRKLAKEQGNIRSFLNRFRAKFDKKNKSRERERERERANSPILPELSIEKEVSEQNHSSMPDNSELDSPTTVVGEEEYYTDSSEKDKTPQAKLEHGIYNCQDYERWWVNEQFKLKDNAVRLAQNQLDEKDQIIFELSSECGNLEAQLGFEQTRNQIVYDTLNSVVIERDILAKKYAYAKGKIERRERGLRKLSEQLTTEEELVDIKQRRIDNLTEQVNKLKSKNNSQQEKIILLVQQLENQNKNFTRLIKKLVKKVAQLNKKGNREHNRKRINNLNQKLEVLTTEQETLQTENNSLKGQLTYYQDQDSKLRTTIHSLQSHVCPPPVPHACSPCSLPHLPTPHVCPVIQQINCSHTDYDNLKTELTEKENIIQRQAQRIRELENKPPLVETKTQIKEVIREVEKEVEKPTATLNAPFNEDLIKIIEINLQGLEKELNIPLSSEIKAQIEQATNYQELSNIRNQAIKNYLEKERNTGITSQPKEIIKPIARERIIWISLLAVSLLVIGGLVVKLRKSSNKRSLS